MSEEPKPKKRGGARRGAGRKPKAAAQKVADAQTPEPQAEKSMRGRPVEYDAEVFRVICDRIAAGGFLSLICAEEGMPSETTFRRWKNASDELRLAYAHAREDRADLWADEIVQIADDASGDLKVVGRDGNEREVCDAEFVQRSRLRIDTRKWLMGKHAPRDYGEKASIELSGRDGQPIEVTPLSDRELAQRVAHILQAGIGGAKAVA